MSVRRVKLRTHVQVSDDDSDESDSTYVGPGTERWENRRAAVRNMVERERDLVSNTYLKSWDTNSGHYQARFLPSAETKAQEDAFVIELQKMSIWSLHTLVVFLRLPYGVTLEVKAGDGFAAIWRNLPTPECE